MNTKQVEKGLVDTLWGVFSSVRLSVIVLTLLAVTSIIGTVIPQNASPAIYVDRFGEAAYRVLSFLDIFDMYHSWWFQLLLVLLGINLVVCSMDRLPAVLKIIGKTQRLNPENYRRAAKGDPLAMAKAPGAVAEDLSARLTSSMGRFTRVDEGEARYLFAEKGRWTRLGVYVVHAGVLLLLVGGLLGSLFGYEGAMNITEGETSGVVRLNGSNAALPLPFELRCDTFSVSFYDTGAPKEYRSDLVVVEGGRDVLSRKVVVNDPLRYKGISFYQASYGMVPPESASFSFTSKASGMSYPAEGTFGEPIDIPEGLGTFTPLHFMNNYRFRNHSIGATVLGLLKKEGGETVRLALPVKSPNFDRMRQGEVVISVANFENRYYTGLQVTKDPGVWLVYAGFLFLIAGCYITFFMSHRGFMVEVLPGPSGSAVTLYGNANKNRLGMEMVIRRLTEKLDRETRTPERQVEK
ncbi:cytochrome c biogenesis protein ResB [Desulfoluna spongiiphila]|uniref:cytochrome c biogenesis protein ResB n=1 Tax=Desulfoluna spongiiphila TaxID=419481 RepID=UPI00125B3AB1|nr:cytochrome c biogenesis protein ResB [Desulfoluna spongiiphila]VVS93840.1 resb-like domain [Desulfoluna spongiiphila]